MEIRHKVNKCIIKFYDPNEISVLMAFCLFCVSIVPFLFMIVYYDEVIREYDLIDVNPIYKMLNESYLFMKNIKDNMCGKQLLQEYQWLNSLNVTIHENCYITPSLNLQYLNYAGYILAGYNTLLIYIIDVKLPRRI